MQLDLTDEETQALIRLVRRALADDRYPDVLIGARR
jgi:hypothetical protein